MAGHSESILKTHHGLQALCAIASSAQSFLGPSQRFKTVLGSNGENGVLVTSCIELLQAWDIQHPVGEIVKSACLTQHKIHGSCVTTLLAMVGCWSSAIQTLLNQGVPISVIRLLGDECLQLCIDTAIKHGISLPHHNYLCSAPESMLPSGISPSESDIDPQNSVQSDFMQTNSDKDLLMPREKCASENSSDFLEKSLPYLEPQTVTTPVERMDYLLQTDSENDISWFFEGSSGLEDVDGCLDLEIARRRLLECDAKPERILQLERGNEFTNSSFLLNINKTCPKPISAINLFLKKCEQTVQNVKSDAVEDDDEFEDCFRTYASSYNITSLSDINDVATWKSNEWREPFKCQPCESTCVSSDEEFEDCIPDTLSNKKTKTFVSASHLYKTVSPIESNEVDGEFSRLKIRNATSQSGNSVRAKSVNALNDSDKTHTTSSDLMGQSRSCQMQFKSKKVINNSRHFRTVETVLEEHKDDIPEEIKGRAPRHRIECSELGFKDQGDEEEKLQLLLKEKLSLNSTNIPHPRMIGQSRHFRNAGQQDHLSVESHDDRLYDVIDDSSADIKMPIVFGEEKRSTNTEEHLDIWDIGAGLNHGADREMKLAVQVYLSQAAVKDISTQMSTIFQFDYDNLFVCCITGPSEVDSHIVKGLVLPVREDQLHTITSQLGNSLKCLLINGDLKTNARHTGYRESIKPTTIQFGGLETTQENKWLTEVKTVLKELKIDILLTKGLVAEDLLDFCASNGVVVLQQTPYKALLALSGNGDILTYITDATQSDAVSDLSLALYKCGWQPRPLLRKPNLKRTHYIILQSKKQPLIQTAVICSPIISGHLGTEGRFWQCTHRLSNAIKDGKVLPGAGAIEIAVIRQLNYILSGEATLQGWRRRYHHPSWLLSVAEEYTPAVATAFKEAFMQFLIKTLQNCADFTNVTDIKCMIQYIVEEKQSSVTHKVNTNGNKTQILHPDNINKCILDNKKSHTAGNTGCEEEKNGTSSRYHLDDVISFLSSCVYDPYESKMAAWSSAWEIVKIILQIDNVIVSGTDHEQSLL